MLLIFRWLMLVQEANQMNRKYEEEDREENRYFSSGKKIVMTEAECAKLSTEELVERYNSGKYFLPLGFESYVEEYKSLSKVLGRKPNPGLIPNQIVTIVTADESDQDNVHEDEEAEERRLRRENRKLLRARRMKADDVKEEQN